MNSFGDKSMFGNNEEEDDDDDDHMESSRIISPKSRFRPSFGGTEGIRNRNLMGQFDGSLSSSNKPSPVEKFKNIGRTAWSFFSRPLGTSTPCSDVSFSN